MSSVRARKRRAASIAARQLTSHDAPVALDELLQRSSRRLRSCVVRGVWVFFPCHDAKKILPRDSSSQVSESLALCNRNQLCLVAVLELIVLHRLVLSLQAQPTCVPSFFRFVRREVFLEFFFRRARRTEAEWPCLTCGLLGHDVFAGLVIGALPSRACDQVVTSLRVSLEDEREGRVVAKVARNVWPREADSSMPLFLHGRVFKVRSTGDGQAVADLSRDVLSDDGVLCGLGQ